MSAGDDLRRLLVRHQALGNPSVVVPDEVSWGAGIPVDDHPRNWIPRLDERPPACGESRRLRDSAADVWCLRPEGHSGDHW